jgi:uncharacterized protein DUF3465
MTRVAVLATAVLVLVACGGRESADDAGLQKAIENSSAGAEVTFNATVVNDPIQFGDHEQFSVRTTSGQILEVDHNTKLAGWIPLHKGDTVVIHGELYIDPGPQIGVHCTHAATSSGCPNPGWIEYDNSYYE